MLRNWIINQQVSVSVYVCVCVQALGLCDSMQQIMIETSEQCEMQEWNAARSAHEKNKCASIHLYAGK